MLYLGHNRIGEIASTKSLRTYKLTIFIPNMFPPNSQDPGSDNNIDGGQPSAANSQDAGSDNNIVEDQPSAVNSQDPGSNNNIVED